MDLTVTSYEVIAFKTTISLTWPSIFRQSFSHQEKTKAL